MTTLTNAWKKLHDNMHDNMHKNNFENFEVTNFHQILIKSEETEVTNKDVEY